MRVPNRILVMRSPGETRAALLADDDLIEVAHVRDVEAQPGAIYAGRVGERVPKSADVFVDIGLPPHGVLETKGARFAAGQLIAVEVLTPARADKGHKLRVSKLSVPADVQAPGVLKAAPDPVAVWYSRYGTAISEIAAVPRSQAVRLKDVLGSPANVVMMANADAEFDVIDEQIQSALSNDVVLPSGGRLIIEQMAALVAVDIDSGSSSIDVANEEAMVAVAHHMRLRNLAGHILVDLIPTRARRRFVKLLTDACADDPVKVQVMGLTPSGMIDVVRPRMRPSLAEAMCDSSLRRPSDDTIAYTALRRACRELTARRAAGITLLVSAPVATVLNERLAGALREARTMASGDIAVVARADFTRERVEVS
jgi:ribonuclease G